MTIRATVLLALLIVVGSIPARSADPLVIEPNGAAVPSGVIAPQATDEVATPGPQPEADDFVIGRRTRRFWSTSTRPISAPTAGGIDTARHPRVLKRLVDTGAVRFVHRDMPLSPLAFKAAVLTLCAAPDQRDRVAACLDDDAATPEVPTNSPPAKLCFASSNCRRSFSSRATPWRALKASRRSKISKVSLPRSTKPLVPKTARRPS